MTIDKAEEITQAVEEFKASLNRLFNLGVKVTYVSYTDEWGYQWCDVDDATDFNFSNYDKIWR